MTPTPATVSVNPTIFLGLVTHRGTRYPQSIAPEGLVPSLAAALAAHGVEPVVSLHSDDLHTNEILPLTTHEVRRSIDAELALETRWRLHVQPTQSRVRLRSLMVARRIYRELRLAPQWRRNKMAGATGQAMLRRLVNIEMAHMHLLREARAQEADWALLVEDDAYLSDPEGFAAALLAFTHAVHQYPQPAYVNVSRSFSHERLDLGSHLTPVGTWSSGVQELSADVPLTNTVCAILYRGSFLDVLVPALEAIPVSPVLPIDWKFNQALLDLYADGRLGAGDCWFLDPAPVLQGSMHEANVATDLR